MISTKKKPLVSHRAGLTPTEARLVIKWSRDGISQAEIRRRLLTRGVTISQTAICFLIRGKTYKRVTKPKR